MIRSVTPLRYTALAALALALAACGGSKDAAETAAAAAPGGATPEAAVMDSVRLLRANDIAGVVSNSVPPARLEEAKSEWMSMVKQDEVSDEDRAQFAETMAKLTGPNAEAELMAEIRPQLEQFSGEMRAQLPMMVAMGKGFIVAAINESEDLTAEQKPQVINLVNALGTWAESGEFASVERAERAVSEVVKAARRMPAKTLDEVQALDFNGAMNMAGIALEGLKGALTAYDISLDRALDNTRAETIRRDGSEATVRVHTELFNSPLNYDVQMVEIDGRWYSKDAIENTDSSN